MQTNLVDPEVSVKVLQMSRFERRFVPNTRELPATPIRCWIHFLPRRSVSGHEVLRLGTVPSQ